MFTLVDNQANLPILGTFDARPNGSLLTVNGWTFRINYDGVASGSSVANDVILTVVTDPAHGTIAGRAWIDVNANGIRDGSEGGLGNVLVKLLDTSDNLIATTTTASDGSYTFTNVASGTFRIQYVLPPEYTFTAKDAGSDDSIDSDADASGYTDYFNLMPGQTLTDWDAGGLGGVGIIPIEI